MTTDPPIIIERAIIQSPFGYMGLTKVPTFGIHLCYFVDCQRRPIYMFSGLTFFNNTQTTYTHCGSPDDDGCVCGELSKDMSIDRCCAFDCVAKQGQLYSFIMYKSSHYVVNQISMVKCGRDYAGTSSLNEFCQATADVRGYNATDCRLSGGGSAVNFIPVVGHLSDAIVMRCRCRVPFLVGWNSGQVDAAYLSLSRMTVIDTAGTTKLVAVQVQGEVVFYDSTFRDCGDVTVSMEYGPCSLLFEQCWFSNGLSASLPFITRNIRTNQNSISEGTFANFKCYYQSFPFTMKSPPECNLIRYVVVQLGFFEFPLPFLNSQ